MNKFDGEVISDVYQRGGNPDLVDLDRVDDGRARGLTSEECAEVELYRQHRGDRWRREQAILDGDDE